MSHIIRNEFLFANCNIPKLGIDLLYKLDLVTLVKMRKVSYGWQQLIDTDKKLYASIAYKYFIRKCNLIFILNKDKNNFTQNLIELAELDLSYYSMAKEAAYAQRNDHYFLQILKIEKKFENISAGRETFKHIYFSSNKIKAYKIFPELKPNLSIQDIFNLAVDVHSAIQASSYFIKKEDFKSALLAYEKYPSAIGAIKILKKHQKFLVQNQPVENRIQRLYRYVINSNELKVDLYIDLLRSIAENNPRKAEKIAVLLLKKEHLQKDEIVKIYCFLAELNLNIGLKLVMEFLPKITDLKLKYEIQFFIAKLTNDFSHIVISDVKEQSHFFKELTKLDVNRALKLVDNRDEYTTRLALMYIAIALKNEMVLKELINISYYSSVSDYFKYAKLTGDIKYLMVGFQKLEKEKNMPNIRDYIKGAKLAKAIKET